MKSFIFILLSVLLAPCWLMAEESNDKSEITIFSGLSFLDAEVELPGCLICEIPVDLFPFGPVKRSVDRSFLLGFQYGYFMTKNMEVEGTVMIAPNHDIRTEVTLNCPIGNVCPLADRVALFPPFFDERDAVTYHYDGNFVYNFNHGAVSPFLTVGVGGISTDFENSTHSDFALNFGGGAKFYLKNVGLRFEVNDHVIPDYFLTEETEHDLQVRYGFLFRL